MSDDPTASANPDVAMPETDPVARRRPLAPMPDPAGRRAYLVSFTGQVPPFDVILRYVPDRLVTSAEAVEQYFDALATLNWPGPEALANALRDDVNNALIPYWLEILVEHKGRRLAQQVIVTDRQPGWRDRDFLWSR